MSDKEELEQNVKQPFVCAGCTCLCDDVQLISSSSSQESVRSLHDSISVNTCEKGKNWLREFSSLKFHDIQGNEVCLEEAIDEAKILLANSKALLICGLEGLCTDSQRSAWNLADRHRATIDTTLNESGRGSTYALQRVGRVTATLGEVAQRADFILFWFCNPVETHPRHLERYSRPISGKKRKIIVVDEKETATTAQSDRFIKLPREQGSLTLTVLRSLLNEVILDETAVVEQTGRTVSEWTSVLQQMTKATYGTIFSSATDDAEFDSESEELARLVRSLNNRTRFVLIPLREDGNALSAENVLAWSSGFSSAVNLNRGYPRNFYHEYSAERLLERHETDLILLASTACFQRNWSKLSSTARKRFLEIPKIVLREAGKPGELRAHVEISVARPGHTSTGDFCRQDDVCLPLPAIRAGENLVRASEVLDRLSR